MCWSSAVKRTQTGRIAIGALIKSSLQDVQLAQCQSQAVATHHEFVEVMVI